MKTSRLIFSLFLLPLMMVSCKKDGEIDRELNAKENQLVGTWNATSVVRQLLDANGEVQDEQTITDIDVTFVFKANGKVIDNEGFEGTFRVENDRIIISYEDDDDYIYDIVSLTATEAVVLFEFDGPMGRTKDRYTLVKQ